MSTVRQPAPGTPAERTALAWRRTAFTVAVGSLAAARLLPERLGPAGVVVGVAGLLWSLDLALTARRRYAAARALVGEASPSPAPPSAHPAASRVAGPDLARTSVLALVVGALALVGVAVLSTGR